MSTWVRGPEVIKAHDKAIVYIQNWWEKYVGRALIGNVTGDPYGIDLCNDSEYVHINYRTGKGIWNKGSFPYPTLRELYHKLRKFKELKEKEKKQVYVIHVATDYSRFVMSEIDKFDMNNRKLVDMPSETNETKNVKRWVCYSSVFQENILPSKKFSKDDLTILQSKTQTMLSQFSQGDVS